MMNTFLMGAVATLYLVAAVFFLKFWRRTRDRLFLAFFAAFAIEGLNRIRLFNVPHPNEGSVGVFLVRLVAFLIVLVAIVLKSRGRDQA